MITVIHYILYIVLVLSVVAAALYSIRARRDPLTAASICP